MPSSDQIFINHHIAIHTWPEYGSLHLDLLTCSKDSELTRLSEVVQKVFAPTKFQSQQINY